MRFWVACLVALLCACAPSREELPASKVYGPGRYQPPELLVRFRPGISDRQAQRLIAGQGAQVLGRRLLGQQPLYFVLLPPNASVAVAAEQFSALPEVLYAEPNFQRRPQGGAAVSRPEQGTQQNE